MACRTTVPLVDPLIDRIAGQNGETLALRVWRAPTTSRGVVVIVHGFGEHGGRYQHVAEALVARGYGVYAHDHRGHGRSTGHRALIDRHDWFLDDLSVVVDRVVADYPGVPLFLLGHSMGGNLALAWSLRFQHRLRGLVLSGPAVTTHGVPKPLLFLAKVLGRVAPKAGVRTLDASGVSRDAHVVDAYRSDPLVFHGKMPAGTGAALLRTSEAFPSQLPLLNVPLLVIHGTDDKLVSVESGKTAHQLAGSSDKTIHLYDGLYHEVLNEPEKARVLTDVLAWLDARTV